DIVMLALWIGHSGSVFVVLGTHALLLNSPAPSVIYTLSLHDALPIWACATCCSPASSTRPSCATPATRTPGTTTPSCSTRHRRRSEEHTSELQSRFDLVCRLLLEKKKLTHTKYRLRM